MNHEHEIEEQKKRILSISLSDEKILIYFYYREVNAAGYLRFIVINHCLPRSKTTFYLFEMCCNTNDCNKAE